MASMAQSPKWEITNLPVDTSYAVGFKLPKLIITGVFFILSYRVTELHDGIEFIRVASAPWQFSMVYPVFYTAPQVFYQRPSTPIIRGTIINEWANARHS